MSVRTKRRWLGVIVAVLLVLGTGPAASAYDLRPPDEAIRHVAEGFDQNWRLEAGRKYDEIRNTGAGSILSHISVAVLTAIVGVLLLLLVKRNHMEKKIKKVPVDLLCVFTRMWLISRWGLRY